MPPKPKAPPPFPFVLELLEDLEPATRPMFGCLAIYHDGKILLALREKDGQPEDNGVWLATTPEHHASLRKDLPSLRSIRMFGPGESGWQILPASEPSFETEVEKAIRFIKKGDPRIGKVPQSKKSKRKKK